MKVPFVALDRENVARSPEFQSAFWRVLSSGRYLMGPEVAAVEAALAEWHKVDHCVGVASGTDACEVALRACGLSEGKTVKTPAFGCPPTISAIEAAGATPVLVDVDPMTRGVSFATLREAKADGAIVVHMFGEPCDVPADAVEDCAHAQGATQLQMSDFAVADVSPPVDGISTNISMKLMPKVVGSIGRAGALSFFPTKCLGIMGDGGAIVTSDEGVASRARSIRHYGGLLDGDVSMRGQNSRLSELSAAFVAIKLAFLKEANEKRRKIASRYSAELKGRVTVPRSRFDAEAVYHCYVIEHPERDRIKADLEARGIGCMIHYPKALHQYSRWAHLGEPGQFPTSERLAATVLSLPCFPTMTDVEVEAVIAAVREVT